MSQARPRPPVFLAVFAHPDDESFGPGGTLAKYARHGAQIHLVVATRGERSTIGHSLELGPGRLGSVREEELRRAARILGIQSVTVLGYPDTQVNQVDPQELTAQVGEHLDRLRPDVVIAFHPRGITGNPDHVAVTRAVIRAYEERFQGPLTGPRLFLWTIPEEVARLLRQSSDIPFAGTPRNRVHAVVDISRYAAVQWEAIRCHRSQSDPPPEVLVRRLKAQRGKEYFALHMAPTGLRPLDDLLGAIAPPSS